MFIAALLIAAVLVPVAGAAPLSTVDPGSMYTDNGWTMISNNTKVLQEEHQKGSAFIPGLKAGVFPLHPCTPQNKKIRVNLNPRS
ncbi:MAG: hypothetical protein PWP08_1548 [Methanofollis sp.]|nr:hypothetical protein [Methanofollis sp.]